MNMPQVTSTSPHDPSTPAVVRLVNTAGHKRPATPREVAAQLQAGRFFWLDLEDPGDDELAEFSEGLRIPAGTIVSLVHARARSSFAPAADWVQAVLPAAVDTKQTDRVSRRVAVGFGVVAGWRAALDGDCGLERRRRWMWKLYDRLIHLHYWRCNDGNTDRP